jgi:hypothetical protein
MGQLIKEGRNTHAAHLAASVAAVLHHVRPCCRAAPPRQAALPPPRRVPGVAVLHFRPWFVAPHAAHHHSQETYVIACRAPTVWGGV